MQNFFVILQKNKHFPICCCKYAVQFVGYYGAHRPADFDGIIVCCKLVRENSPHHIYVGKIKGQLNNRIFTMHSNTMNI